MKSKTDYKYIDMFLQMLNCYEFTLHYANNVFYVEDLQRGNLGNIENDVFNTLQDVCERMEAYHLDYLYRAVEEDEELSVWDLAAIYLVENSNNLSECNVSRFKEYLMDKKLESTDYEEDYKIVYSYGYFSNYSHCFWHGGNVVNVYSKYGNFSINAIGEVRCSLYAKKDFITNNGEKFKKGDLIASVVDKNEGGVFYQAFGDYIYGDNQLLKILKDNDENLYLDVENNNWLELIYNDNNGCVKIIEDYESLDIEDAIKYIEELIEYKDKNNNFEIFKDEIKVDVNYDIEK